MKAKLDKIKTLIINEQDKLSSLSQNVRIDLEVDRNMVIWPQILPF